MFERKYSEADLTNAVFLIINQGISPAEVSRQTGINLRTLQRYKNKHIKEQQEEKTPDYPVVFKKDNPISHVQKQLDNTLLTRAKFLDDVMETKQIVLNRIRKVAHKSDNLDALQRTAKTLSDIEKEVLPDGDTPAVHANTVNMFQFFNQQLLANGYKGPELTDADIIKGD